VKIKLDLYHPYELEAFAVFTAAVAAGKAAYDATQPKDTLWGLAGIDRTQNPAWKVTGVGETAEATDDTPPTAETIEKVAAEKKTRQRKPKDAPAVSSLSTDTGQTDIEDAIAQQSISTGGERVGPEDSPEVVAQDAADEAAETAATKTALTLDDVRNALGVYVQSFGLDAAMLDGPVVITKVCGEGKVKVSDVPEDKIAAVIAGVEEMLRKNPFARAKVAA